MEPLNLSELAPANRISVELASQRTRMAFQRTRMGADRTLMAIMRTSFSFIAFGFTAFQFLRFLNEQGHPVSLAAARWFGISLIGTGVLLEFLGIWKHVQFMLELQRERKFLEQEHILLGKDRFSQSLTLVVAIALLLAGVLVFVTIAIQKLPLPP